MLVNKKRIPKNTYKTQQSTTKAKCVLVVTLLLVLVQIGELQWGHVTCCCTGPNWTVGVTDEITCTVVAIKILF